MPYFLADKAESHQNILFCLPVCGGNGARKENLVSCKYVAFNLGHLLPLPQAFRLPVFNGKSCPDKSEFPAPWRVFKGYHCRKTRPVFKRIVKNTLNRFAHRYVG